VHVSNRFRRTRAGIEAKFGAAEAAALRRLFTELVDLLDDGDGDPAAASADPLERLFAESKERSRPDDPVLARLLPDAYADDEAASSEYRRLTEGDLRAGKVAAASAALASLQLADDGRVRLDGEGAQAWLSALNDLRLSLGTRFEVTEDLHEEVERMPSDDPRLPGLSAYLWLGWLQETLVQAVAGW